MGAPSRSTTASAFRGAAAPCIRNDVSFLPGKRPGVVEVRDWQRQRTFTLYDIEANIAQMLDGERTLEEVVSACARIGITATVQSLHNFARLLGSFGLLSDEPALRQRPRGRRVWSEALRERYRDALLQSRTGKLDAAAETLKALLEEDPDSAEVASLLAQVQHWRRNGGRPELSFEMLHSGVRRARVSLSPPPQRQPVAPLPANSPLPPLWTASVVAKVLPLPTVGDSVLAFDPAATRADDDEGVEVVWDEPPGSDV